MRRSLWFIVASLVLVMLPAVTNASAELEIRVLSNRADLVSGGDALVEIVLPEGETSATVGLDTLGDVSGAFALRDDGRYLGRIEGMPLGANLVTATAGAHGATLTITNHSIDGPIFSGPHIWPWVCTTSSNGLGPAGPGCHADTVVQYLYRPTNGGSFAAYDPQNPPSDVATTTTDEGETVPFIIRQETGTQNRGIYRLAVLHDPAEPFEPWDVYRGWNQKLFYPFGASCGTQYTQGAAQNVQNATALGRGFMVATSSLNVLGNNCNTVLSAETVMMLKEHIVDRFGEIRYTFGTGVSGGSIGQHMVANSYPGLLQGITTGLAYPDTTSTGAEVFDCHLLVQYFVRNPHLWGNPLQQSAVSGHGTSLATCVGWEALFAPVEDPKTGCGPVPAAEVYHPETNPAGARCAYQDFERNVWGMRPESLWIEPEQARVGQIGEPFANYLFNNKGIQYGLGALRDGLITPEQFVHLNENIGSFDVDFNLVPERTVADPGVAEIAYRSGRINDASNLDKVAIIDTRGGGNWDAFTIHTMHHSFALKHRLQKAHGTSANHVLWRGGAPGQVAQSPVDAGQTSFDLMDQWLSGVESDPLGSLTERILRNKPETAREACFAGPVEINDEAACDVLWPYYASPRIVAGGPASHDVFQCQLESFSRSADYGPLPFTEGQWERLETVFADGVCDWDAPSVGHGPAVPWLDYSNGAGGVPLGAPPESVPL